MTHKINMRIFRTGFKFLALMLAFTGIFLISSDAFINVKAVDDTLPEPTWDKQGSVNLNKTATKVDGSDDKWRIDLSIDGKDYKTTTDIVLVIDISNSMSWSMAGIDEQEAEPGYSRLDYTKIAAKSFVSNIIGRNTNNENRIALVSFKSTATIVSDFSANKTKLENSIDSLRVPGDNTGGTNMQAGLYEAEKLLNDKNKSQAQNKVIVILGDGSPTRCYYINSVSGVTVQHISENKHNLIYDINSVEIDYSVNQYYVKPGFYIKCSGCLGKAHIDNGILPAEYEATKIKNNGINIYSVALGADDDGVQTLKNISDTGSGAFFTEIPSTTTESTVQKTLNSAFKSIAASISAAAKDGYVIDPMGEMFDLVSDVSEIQCSQGSVELSEDKRQIKWKVGTVKEGTTAKLSYIVRIKDTAESGIEYPTNKTTTFYYKNYLGKNTSKNFPIPTAAISYGFINVVCYLSDNNGNPIDSDGKTVSAPEQALILKQYDFMQNNSNKLSLNKSYTLYAPNDIDNTIFIGSYTDKPPIKAENTVSVNLTVSSLKHTVYFAYSMNNGTFVLTKTGDLLADESSVFRIEGSDGSVSYETIQGTGSKTFKNLTVGITYTITEITDWSWKYETTGENPQTVCIKSSKESTVSFENKGGTKWLTDESFASNVFNKSVQ
ncbi:MAG: VWA domain-containing protein [Clostridia bacterium]|nr:VWA domain-containing protein [Clostridia bacterium]